MYRLHEAGSKRYSSPLSDYVEIQESVEQAILQGLALDIQKRYFYMGNLMEKLEMDTTHVRIDGKDSCSVWGENGRR